ncbi:MAG: hypothetical protein R2991_04390 [Thermoanaerobaculia bacterium]
MHMESRLDELGRFEEHKANARPEITDVGERVDHAYRLGEGSQDPDSTRSAKVRLSCQSATSVCAAAASKRSASFCRAVLPASSWALLGLLPNNFDRWPGLNGTMAA